MMCFLLNLPQSLRYNSKSNEPGKSTLLLRYESLSVSSKTPI